MSAAARATPLSNSAHAGLSRACGLGYKLRNFVGDMSSVSGGVPARVGAPGTLYMEPMTTDHEVLLWILLGAGGGMTYGRWRAERIRARHTMAATWNDRKKNRGAKTWKLW